MLSQFAEDFRADGCHPFSRDEDDAENEAGDDRPMDSAALSFRSCWVKSVINPAASSGRNRINQGNEFQVHQLEFHRRQIFDMRGLALAVERHDQRQADRHFRRRHGDDEEHQDLAVEVVVEPREGDQREVGRVEHQFERHVDDQQVAPHDDAEQAERKQQRADDQIMFKPTFIFCTSKLIIKTSVLHL